MSRPARGGLAPWQERRATEIPRANLKGGVALREVARECGLSVGYFSHAEIPSDFVGCTGGAQNSGSGDIERDPAIRTTGTVGPRYATSASSTRIRPCWCSRNSSNQSAIPTRRPVEKDPAEPREDFQLATQL